MRPIKELKQILSTPKKIFITTHARPDGDALGSMLAIYHYLAHLGHAPVAVAPTGYGMYLQWLPGNAGILIFPENEEKVLNHLKESELLICLDFNNFGRTEKLEEHLAKTKIPKVMIDHHLDPQDFDDYRLWDPDAVSTTELVYRFFEAMDDLDRIDAHIATCLYTGLVTDSGSFRYDGVSGDVHRMVAHLFDCGLNHTDVHRRLFDSSTEDRLRFFGYILYEKMAIIPEYRAACISVSMEEMDRFGITTSDLEGLVNYPLSIDEVVFVALMTERSNGVRISMRSKGTFPANEFAKQLFEGGGHHNAAGGSFDGALKDAESRFKEGLETFRSLLLAT